MKHKFTIEIEAPEYTEDGDYPRDVHASEIFCDVLKSARTHLMLMQQKIEFNSELSDAAKTQYRNHKERKIKAINDLEESLKSYV